MIFDTSWFFDHTTTKPVRVTLTPSHLAQFRKLQQIKEHEVTGHIDVGTTGDIERIVTRKGKTVASVSADFEVSFHTHPSDYVNTFPEHPSVVDARHVLYSLGKVNDVGTHIIFTPSFIYVIQLSAELRTKIKQGRFNELAEEAELGFSKAAAEAGNDRSGPLFRARWIRSLRDLGFLIHVHGGMDNGATAYSQPLSFDVLPKELNVQKVAGVTASASIGAVVLGVLVLLTAR